jgi:hypothetical protein
LAAQGTPVEQAAQAATLLLAKDRLNGEAKPANGASIVFTLMVAGDDEDIAAHRRRTRGLCVWLGRMALSRPTDRSSAPDKRDALPIPSDNKGAKRDLAPDATINPAPRMSQDGGGGENGEGKKPRDTGNSYPPSRLSLAKLAYPGLVGSARRFKRRINALLFLLFACLICTCILSWHIATGHAILTRLDAIESARIAIQKRIADAEVEEVKHSAPAPGVLRKPVQRYCERASRLPLLEGVKIDQFEDATQRQICDELAENRVNYSNAREDVADWLAPWELLKWISHKMCGQDRCLKDEAVRLSIGAINQQQWAAVLVDVLANAVLPLCYGFLGAGAAVVRNIWGKMRDSLLSPRDLTISLGQLALGAVIGACIGLFITPTGGGSQATGGLTSSISLTPSALSFIAGFGVEGVFVALESLVKRVFPTKRVSRPPSGVASRHFRAWARSAMVSAVSLLRRNVVA